LVLFMVKKNLIAFWSGTACILLGVSISGQQSYYGGLLGFWVGYGYVIWLQLVSKRSSGLDIHAAIKRMRRSLLVRLGVVALVVAAVARFQPSWLFSLAIGIAAGVVLAFIIVAIIMIKGERGDKKSA
jgi:membrane protein YqaA with SNARE-associated domain